MAIRKKVEDLEKSLQKVTPPTTLVMVEMDEKRKTHVMARGSYLSPKQKVEADVPQVLNDWKPEWPKNRLGLAKWLVDPENPLTARVIVNRWWGQFFGSGIVSTEEDFGSQSEPPTHPELLDWLAVEFMENGWSMKHIHKLIALSGTYGQSSRVTTSKLERDANNRFFLRGPRFRMTAEMIRDNGLQIAGLLIGRSAPKDVHASDRDVDLFDVKADALAILSAIGAPGKTQIRRGAATWWHPGRHGQICLGPKKTLAVFGELHPKILAAFDIKGPAVGFTIWPNEVPLPRNNSTTRPALKLKDLQAVERDFAFVVDHKTEAMDLVNAAQGADKTLITDVRVFDEFIGGSLGVDRKSIAIRVRLQPIEVTLTDAEIEAVGAKIVAKVASATGGALRM